TTPPAEPAWDLAPGSDTGAQGDGITDAERVDLAGQAEPNATLTLIQVDGPDAPIQTTTSDAQGHFTFAGVPLAFGAHPYRVLAEDPAGNTGSSTHTLTSLAPDGSPPEVHARLERDTGSDATDGLTSDPTITGIVLDASPIA